MGFSSTGKSEVVPEETVHERFVSDGLLYCGFQIVPQKEQRFGIQRHDYLRQEYRRLRELGTNVVSYGVAGLHDKFNKYHMIQSRFKIVYLLRSLMVSKRIWGSKGLCNTLTLAIL